MAKDFKASVLHVSELSIALPWIPKNSPQSRIALGKITAKTRNEKIRRCGSTLDLIHRDICGPLTPTALGGYKYFITFIDDFSRYGYVELIHEKFDSLNVFKAFKAKRELRLGKHIKVVKSDRGGKYYGRYDEIGWNPRPFANFLLECSIDARYTMSGTPQRNGVAEMRNRKLLDMVEVRPYNPQSKKLDPKTISGFFVGYCIGSRGSGFYCPSHTTRIIECGCSYYPTVGQIKESIVIKWNLAFLLMEYEYDGYDASDLVTYQKSIQYPQFTSWKEVMDDEMNSMYMNGVWNLVELPHGCKPVGCKWVFKTKCDSSRQIERYKARLVVKGYSQIEGIDFKETFSPVSTNDSFRVIMVIVAHFDLELHQMDVKTAFLNGDLDEDVYMDLMYAQVCKRSDIAFVVAMLGRYLSNHGSQHWKAAKKVLRYLQGTKDLMLTYQRINILDVVGFCDTDFDDCIDDKKSTTCYIFVMARGIVSWKSVKQTLTASSTMENTRSTSRFKHIDVKFYFVKEKVAKSLIDIEHMSTKGMLADPPTKGLPIVVFHEHVSQMGLLGA
ncbi:Retrovirus-related Pol polyprotein from transposon TNT 1-94 [Vitis vinifera]|uniref:Retrovirus-related Pol polyprotein from transposon TNT 1-94 n=1 Tax=Vitis vinifera TaxID=29760 RepID=A0A438IAZ5_VITVI|nr:Retrovirus-related Pol polyprotein from transposon TNT 1-94 [Vitis vinifera]